MLRPKSSDVALNERKVAAEGQSCTFSSIKTSMTKCSASEEGHSELKSGSAVDNALLYQVGK